MVNETLAGLASVDRTDVNSEMVRDLVRVPAVQPNEIDDERGRKAQHYDD